MAPSKKAVQATPVAATRTVRVRALQRGYWEHKLWEEGTVFMYTLPADHPLPTWMQDVSSRSSNEDVPVVIAEEPSEENFGPTFTSDVI